MRKFLRMEPLEERRMLTMVAVPSSTVGELSTFGEVDSYTFNATGGEDYYITAEFLFTTTLEPNRVGTTGLRLFNEDGLSVAGGFFIQSVRPLSFIRWNAPADGTYDLEVSEIGSVAKGAYTLTVELATDDHGDAFDEATVVEVPSATTGSLATLSDRDMFSFSSIAGGHYRVLNRGGLMEVFNSDGERLFFNQCSARRCNPPDFSFVAPNASDYFVSVVDAANYRLEIDFVNPFDDHGNTPASATLLTDPAVAAGEFEVPGDADFFAFEARAGTQYNVSTLFAAAIEGNDSNNVVASMVRIYDTDGSTKLVHDDGGLIETTEGTYSSLTSWAAPDDGIYFIELVTPNFEVSAFGRADQRIVVGNYVIGVAVAGVDDHGSDPSAATMISVPSKTTGRFEFAGDVDVFAFEMVAGQRYGFHLDAQLDDTISLLDVDGTTVLDTSSIRFSSTQIDWTVPVDGIYFVSLTSALTVDEYTFAIHLPCDLVEIGDGCNRLDVQKLQSNADVTDESIQEWLIQASRSDNVAKARPEDVYRIGDVDLDGDVDSADLGQLLNFFSNRPLGPDRFWGQGNLNADEHVNSTDLGLLLNELGFASPTPALATSADLSVAASDSDMNDFVFSDVGEDDDEDEESIDWRAGRMRSRSR